MPQVNVNNSTPVSTLYLLVVFWFT